MTEEQVEKLGLINLKGGAAVEMFDRALDRVMENICDVNTTLKPREVILKVKVAPTDDRTIVGLAMLVETKLQGQDPELFTADVRLDTRGRAYGVGREMQRDLPFNNVQRISGGDE